MHISREERRLRIALYQGMTLQAAEKVQLVQVLKGRGFSRAVQVLYLCHSERASACEESAFSTFLAPSLVVPQQVAMREGFSPCGSIGVIRFA